MKKILVLLCLASLMTFGCKSVQEARNFSNCKYSIRNVEVSDYNITSFTFDVYLSITNLNRKTAAAIKKFEGKLFMNDTYIADINLTDIRVEPGATKVQKAQVAVPMTTLGSKLLGLVSMGSATVDYHITGTAYFDTPLGSVPVPIDIGRRGSNN